MPPQRGEQTEINRRIFLGGSVAAAAAAILAACGGNPDATKPTVTTVAATPSASTPGSAVAPTPAATPTSAPKPPASTLQASGSAAATSTETPVPGGRLIIVDPLADQSLDPYKTTSHTEVQFLVYTAYVAKAPDLTYVPYTFESWTTSPDGKEWTFKVRQGIKNSDGSPVDAALLKFIADRMVDPSLKIPGGGMFGPLKSTTVLDPLTIKFTYNVPYPSLFYGISRAEISSKVAFEQFGADFANHPVGPGPYTVKQQIPGNSIVYDRNPDFNWPPPFYKNRGPAYLDGVTIKIIKDDLTIWNALKAGEVHITPIPTTFINEAQTNPDLTIIKRLEPTIRYIAMNCAKPPFNDPLVRQAVTHAIDRESIVKNAMDGYGEALYTPYPVAMDFADNAGMKKIGYAYDPAMGKEKLKQAGYDVSGAVATKGGQPFEVTLLVLNIDFYKRTGQIVQAQLKEIGIKVNIQVVDRPALVDATLAGTHQMIIQFDNGLDPRYFAFILFHSSRIKVTNYAWYSTPDLDALLEQGQAEPDVTKAQAIYQKVQEMVVKAAPWVPIGDAYVFTGVRKEVKDFQVHPHAFYPLPGYLLHDTWLAKK